MRKRLDLATPGDEAEANGLGSEEMHAELACTHTSLRRAARRLGQLYDEALAPIGLTSPQALLLSQIDALAAAEGGEGPTLQVLASRLAIQISALTHALRPLVRDGLVEVRRDAHDRRTKHAVLTSLGEVRLKEMYRLWTEANRRIEAALGVDSTERLRTLADKVASQNFLDTYTASKLASGEVLSEKLRADP